MPTGKLTELRTMGCEEPNEAFLAEFEKELGAANYSPLTIVAYRVAVKDFFAFTLGLDVHQVNHRDVREWVHWMRTRGNSSKSTARHKYALDSFFHFLERIGEVKDFPGRLVGAPKVVRKIPEILSIDEVDRIIAATKTIRDRALFETMYATGLRVTEITSMQVENLDLAGRSVKVLAKGNREHRVPLTERAAGTLTEYLQGRKTGPVFTPEPEIQQLGGVSRDKYGVWRGYWREKGPDGKRRMLSVRLGDYELSTKSAAEEVFNRHLAQRSVAPCQRRNKALDQHTIRSILSTAASAAGIGRRVYPHLLRHSVASHLLDRGMDLRHVQELLGHENILTTQIYTHVSVNRLREAIDKCHPHGGQDA